MNPEKMMNEAFVYSRIGMALISAQRVEYITGELLKHLIEFDQTLYGLTTVEFLNTTPSAEKLRRQTLGQTFNYLKLNPALVQADELESYLTKRNILAHSFWKDYLYTYSAEQAKAAVDFCQDFGEASTKLESFFRGFIYLLALRHVKDRDHLSPQFKVWDADFDYFISVTAKKDR